MDNIRPDIPLPFMGELILSPERPVKIMLPVDDTAPVMKNTTTTTIEAVPVVDMALTNTVENKPLLKKTITTKTTTTTETIVTEEVTPALPAPDLKTIAIKPPTTKKSRTTRPIRTYLDASSVLQTLDQSRVNNQPPPGYTGKFDPKWYGQKKVTYLHPEKGLMEITELVPIDLSSCSKRKSPVHGLEKGVVEPEPVHIRSSKNMSPIHDLEKGVVEIEPDHLEPKPKRSPIHDLEKGIIEPEPVHVQTKEVEAEPQSKHSSYSSFATFTEKKTAPIQLGPKKYNKKLRNVRYTFYNVYRRLFSIVFAANMIGLGFLLYKFRGSKDSSPLLLEHLATGAAANIMVALLARQDYMVNLMFK